jgi:hypothetical protein
VDGTTAEQIASFIREVTRECVSVVDVHFTRPDWLLACSGFKVANVCGVGVAEVLAETRRVILFRNQQPFLFLSMLGSRGADCIIIPEFLNNVCHNEATDMLEIAKTAAAKVVVVVVPHMRQGERSSWRMEDLQKHEMRGMRVGSVVDEWLVGAWKRRE